MELAVLGLFCVMLVLCIALDFSILYALAGGLVVFLLYGKYRRFSWRELAGMCLRGVMTVKNILITFLLIGILTALWRASGTIPVIVCYASALIRPSIFLPMTFLLNCAVSVLTGTAFGTAATMGVICAAMGTTLGVNPALTGGAVLSGAFFGDRCSPVSTSALLVAEVTGTNIYDNIRRMVRTALIPFLAACAIFAVMGFTAASSGEIMDLNSLFAREFRLHWSALLPAGMILALSAMRVNVKTAMTASILTAIPLCLFLQRMPASEMLRACIFGFIPADAEVAGMVSGGGAASMLKVAGIICISSAYSGIFQKTGLLDGAKQLTGALEDRTTSFTATLVTAVVTAMIACNQTLAILLTRQLRADRIPDASDLASDLENTAVVISPLIPWSIAGGVPLASIGAPTVSILAACYLYLLPLWQLTLSWIRKKN